MNLGYWKNRKKFVISISIRIVSLMNCLYRRVACGYCSIYCKPIMHLPSYPIFLLGSEKVKMEKTMFSTVEFVS